MTDRPVKFAGLWAMMRADRWRFGYALASLVVAACLLYLVLLIPQAVIDGVLGNQPDRITDTTRRIIDLMGGREHVAERLWIPLIWISVIAALAGIATYGRQRWSAVASQNTGKRIRDRLQNHVQRIEMNRFDELDSGDLLQRCTSDIDTTQNFLSMQAVEIGRAIVMFLVPLPIMFATDWRMSIAAIWLIPGILWFSLHYFGRVRSVFREKDEAEGRLTSGVTENLVGIRVVRAFNRQNFEIDRFRRFNDEHRAVDDRLYRIFARFWSASDLLCFIQQASVILVGAWLLATDRILVGEFYFFFAAVGMFLWPVRMMGRILAELGKATVAVERLDEILALPIEQDSPDADAAIPSGGRLEIRDLVFSHAEDAPVLRGINLDIAAGETIAIVGPSGGGKSTLVNLLLRFYDRDGGSIRLGGVDIESMPRHALRSRIAAVLQQPFLFSRTIRQNIQLAAPTADQAMVERATVEACIHDSIQRFDAGYDTKVGERGVTLSGGQRQRVAIAQALLQEPDVLILDDALSAVDTGTEQSILEAIHDRRGRHTTLIIAHRLSTLKEADRIIVLTEGVIAQQGTHQSLRDTPGLYRRLWEIQASVENDGDDPAAADSGGAT
ncbi:MAG: ABC transporter ATP-binding protein [Phycisphaerales bacterium]|jgi:ATP-binding cassette subfamily B protein|nr:ABC transporter ATP-binding protein [Phycisphaerales bacterium]